MNICNYIKSLIKKDNPEQQARQERLAKLEKLLEPERRIQTQIAYYRASGASRGLPCNAQGYDFSY